MTASDAPSTPSGDAHSIRERALDVFVYLPAGALLTALEEMPETIAKGRARVDQELRNAKVVGRFAVGFGRRQLAAQVERLATEGHAAPRTAPDTSGEKGAREVPASATGSATGNATGRARHTTPPRDADVDRAIPDYDVLAASQVVRRLDGLGHEELRAVVRHERATRARRTILHRAEQLLEPGTGSGSAGPPGPASPGATA